MIFCFVRETKELTLEEIDRKSSLIPHTFPTSNAHHRGLHGAHQDIHRLRIEEIGSLFLQETRPQEEEYS